MNQPLRIDRVRVVEINLPLKIPFQISGGVMRSRRSLIVEIHADGAVGYGESAPFEFPFYSSETLGSVFALYKDLLIDRIQGKSFDSIHQFDAALRLGVRGNPFARCGFENAFWDLISATEKKTFQELIAEELRRLGVEEKFCIPREQVSSGVAIGIPENEDHIQLRDWIRQYRAEGYRRVKIKIRPGWDLDPCRIARETLGPDFLLWADANASFDLEEHAQTLKALDEFNLAFIEQPLHHDDVLDHARLSAMIQTPICLDESLNSLRVARQILQINASRIWNIKVQRMGGLLEAVKVYALAVKHGIALWGGTMPESGIGAQAILALAGFPGFIYPADIEPSRRWYEAGIDPVEIAMSADGYISIQNIYGVGELIDRKRYQQIGVIR